MKNKKKDISPLYRILVDSKKQWFLISLVIISCALAGVLISLSATIWGTIIDLGTHGQTKEMFNKAVLMVCILVIDSLRVIFEGRISAFVTERMFLDFRIRAFESILTADTNELEKQMRSSDTTLRINSNAETLCEIFANRFTWLFRVFLQGMVATICCFTLSFQLSIAYFILLPISIMLIKKASTPIQKQTKIASENVGKAMNSALDMLNGLTVVKSFLIEHEMNEKFSTLINNAVVQNINTQKINIKMTLIKYLVSIVQLMTLFLIGSVLVSNHTLSVGQVLAFIALSGSIRDAFDLSDNMISTVRQATALSQRLYEVIDLPTEKEGSNLVPDYSEYINISDLSFQYDDNSLLFKNLNMRLRKNEKIGIIGPSGCGKSSIIKIICKFYSHKQGMFSIFGHSIEKWSPVSLRKELALVTQEPLIFSGTIYENLLMGKLDASENEVIQVLKDVQLWDYVQTLEHGMYSDVGEDGSHLSGGQKQRLSIARAILKDAKIILLDEPTSSLDTHTESEIQDAIDRLLISKAAIIVSHRLSALNKVDYIFCLNNGEIVEEGTPSDLLTRNGYYYKIKLHQDVDKL